MTKVDQLAAAAEALSDDQLDALIDIAKGMKDKPFYYTAPPEALALLDRGLAEIAAGQTIPGEEVFARIDKRLKDLGA